MKAFGLFKSLVLAVPARQRNSPLCPLFSFLLSLIPLSSLLRPLFPCSPSFFRPRATTIHRNVWPANSTLKSWFSLTCRPPFTARHWAANSSLLQPSNPSSRFATHHLVTTLGPPDPPLYTSCDNLLHGMNEPTPSPSPAPGSKSSASPSAGTKRKRSQSAKVYAIKKGFKPGIYYSWPDCLAQITGFKGAICEFSRKFPPPRDLDTEGLTYV